MDPKDLTGYGPFLTHGVGLHVFRCMTWRLFTPPLDWPEKLSPGVAVFPSDGQACWGNPAVVAGFMMEISSSCKNIIGESREDSSNN